MSSCWLRGVLVWRDCRGNRVRDRRPRDRFMGIRGRGRKRMTRHLRRRRLWTRNLLLSRSPNRQNRRRGNRKLLHQSKLSLPLRRLPTVGKKPQQIPGKTKSTKTATSSKNHNLKSPKPSTATKTTKRMRKKKKKTKKK